VPHLRPKAAATPHGKEHREEKDDPAETATVVDAADEATPVAAEAARVNPDKNRAKAVHLARTYRLTDAAQRPTVDKTVPVHLEMTAEAKAAVEAAEASGVTGRVATSLQWAARRQIQQPTRNCLHQPKPTVTNRGHRNAMGEASAPNRAARAGASAHPEATSGRIRQPLLKILLTTRQR